MRKSELRQHKRLPAEGPILLEVIQPPSRAVEGLLVDMSAGGFRVSHKDRALVSGTHVRFSYAHGAGVAVAVWTRILQDSVESGFYIVES